MEEIIIAFLILTVLIKGRREIINEMKREQQEKINEG